ncbi:MAG: hypothetical protein ACYDCN_00185 [Bacteroidia bacterium]
MKTYSFIKKNAWWLISMLYVSIIVTCHNIPVFWDMYGQVKIAHYYLDTHFKHLLPNGNGFIDNGHFPLYSLYLAALFKLLGFKLWVAHVSVIPFVVGVLYQLQMFCKRFLSDGKTLVVLLLPLIHPAIAAQSIYLSSEVCFVFLGLWMLNSIKDARASHMVLSSNLMCLLNLRAIPLVILLFVYFSFVKKQKSAWYLVLSILVSMAWLFVHFYASGWFFENNENIGHRSVLGFIGMTKNLFWCFIKLTDFGNIIALIFIALFYLKQKRMDEPVTLLLLATMAVAVICVPLSNPVSNRYFLLVYVLTLPVFMYAISSFTKQKVAVICFVFILFSVQSNWLIKPNRYSNAWDCNLQSLNYFDVRKELDTYVLENHISPTDVAAGFQVYFNDGYYLMNGSNKEYDLLSDTKMNENLYIADSNICNNFNQQRDDYLATHYTLVKSFTKESIYIWLYKRK